MIIASSLEQAKWTFLNWWFNDDIGLLVQNKLSLVTVAKAQVSLFPVSHVTLGKPARYKGPETEAAKWDQPSYSTWNKSIETSPISGQTARRCPCRWAGTWAGCSRSSWNTSGWRWWPTEGPTAAWAARAPTSHDLYPKVAVPVNDENLQKTLHIKICDEKKDRKVISNWYDTTCTFWLFKFRLTCWH